MAIRFSMLCIAVLLSACSSPSGSDGGDAGEDARRAATDDGIGERQRPFGGNDVVEPDDADDAQDDAAIDVDVDEDTIEDGSGEADTTEDTDVDGPVEQPQILEVFPTVILPDAFIYIGGEFLGYDSGDLEGITATVSVFNESGEFQVPLAVVSAVERQMILKTPQDFAEIVGGALGLLEITVPRGSARWLPLYATDDTTFSGKTRLGEGIRGNVYRLEEGTPRLPNTEDACEDRYVLSDDGIACPFTSVVSDDLQINPVDWVDGFPGLSADLREWFAIRFDGQLIVPTTGLWSFEVCSDDGSRLSLDVDGTYTRIANNDGLHEFVCARGDVDLTAGRHGLRLDFFQGPRTRLGLSLRWRGPGETTFTQVPVGALRLFETDPVFVPPVP